jgi:hypothetical protein
MARTAKLDALLAIADLLAPRAKHVVAEVTQAFRSPAGYFKTHHRRLSDRSIDKPRANLPWIALVDALVAARSLVEIDWKTSGEDIAGSLGKLRAVPKKNVAWLAKVNDERSTLELLEECGKKLLASDHLQLAALDILSDSFCLVVVPAADAKRLVALAKAATYGSVDLFTGKGLAAAKRERVARNKRDREEAAREAKRAAKQFEKLRYFVCGDEAWHHEQHEVAVNTGYEAPKKKFYRNHYFTDAKRCAADEAATRAFAAELAQYNATSFYKPIDRRALLKLYKHAS